MAGYPPPYGQTTTTTYAPRMPSRPLGVAILAVLIGILAVFLVLAGILVLLAGTYASAVGFGNTGLAVGVLGAIVLIIGAVLLAVALGLWHQELWALVLCIIVFGGLMLWNILDGNYSIDFFVELILVVYLAAVHKHFL